MSVELKSTAGYIGCTKGSCFNSTELPPGEDKGEADPGDSDTEAELGKRGEPVSVEKPEEEAVSAGYSSGM